MDLETTNWLLTTCILSLSLITILANLLLLVVFCKRRGLLTISNRFVINLLLNNLLSIILIIPLLLIDQQAFIHQHQKKLQQEQDENEIIIINTNNNDSNNTSTSTSTTIQQQPQTTAITVFYCYALQFTFNFIATNSILSIFLISIDQYLAVLYPLNYHKYINKVKSLLLIVLTWLLAIISGNFTLIYGLNARFFTMICEYESNQSNQDFTLVFSYVTVIIFVPFIVICAFYFNIYKAAHENSSRIRKRTRIFVFDVDLCLGERKKFLSKLSNVSMFKKYREESRTAKISSFVIVMVFLCYIPYGVVLILQTHYDIPIIYKHLVVYLVLSSCLLSPILFAYRNRRIQREIKRYFGVHRHRRGGYDLAQLRPKIVINETEFNNVDVDIDQHPNLPMPGLLDPRGSFSSASTQISED